jgi:hypothetical protein
MRRGTSLPVALVVWVARTSVGGPLRRRGPELAILALIGGRGRYGGGVGPSWVEVE